MLPTQPDENPYESPQADARIAASDGQIVYQDLEHLRLLSIFHYVVGGIAALFSCFPFIYLAMGIAFLSGAFDEGPGPPPPAFLGWIFIGIAAVFILIGWSVALSILMAGRFLARHVHYTYCLVVAGIECLFMPFGTILGVFTIIVLIRPAVKDLFESQGHLETSSRRL